MPLTVNTNIPSLTAQRNVSMNNSALATSMERLSSGLRINKAADDAAGLAIATKMDAQVQGLNQAVRNANNAVSLVQTAEGGVNTLTDILQRLRELAVQSSSADNTPSDRATTQQEAASLVAEFTRIASTSQFNTMNLLDGSFTGKYFQIGANYGQTVTFAIRDARGKSLGSRAEYHCRHRRRSCKCYKRKLRRKRDQRQRRGRCSHQFSRRPVFGARYFQWRT